VKKRDKNYGDNRVLKTAMEGFDRTQNPRHQPYHRPDARKEIEEGLEEFQELLERET
jgi:hypothetical protein